MKKLKIIPLFILIVIIGFKTNVSAYNYRDIYLKEECTDLFIGENESVQVFNNISFSKNDIYKMSKVVYGESRGESFKGKVAVASVILNRILSDKFPNTLDGVLYQKNAFSCISSIEDVVPDEDSIRAVYSALSGNDPTLKSLFFYNPSLATSSWIIKANKKDIIKIDNHLFFK